jgi:hypothetical protein
MKMGLVFLKVFNSILYFTMSKGVANHWITPHQKMSMKKKQPDMQASPAGRACTSK